MIKELFEYRGYSFSSSLSLSLLLPLLFTLGCSAHNWGQRSDPTSLECNIRAYTDESPSDYLRSRNSSGFANRIGVIPFSAQETFSDPADNSKDFGYKLATHFKDELRTTEEFDVVELFQRKYWPGKKEDFFSGNFKAIELARHAGYDFAAVGQVVEIRGSGEVAIQVKLIDVTKGITLWHGKSTVSSGSNSKRPDLLYFEEKSEYLAACTVDGMFPEVEEESWWETNFGS